MLRLETRSQFQAVLAGRKLASSTHFVVHCLALCSPKSDSGCIAIDSDASTALFLRSDLWLGPLVPKRWAKRAVTRNAIKRQIFIVSRNFEHALPSGAYVVRLRAGFPNGRFPSASSDPLKQAVREELVQLLEKVAPPGGRRSNQVCRGN